MAKIKAIKWRKLLIPRTQLTTLEVLDKLYIPNPAYYKAKEQGYSTYNIPASVRVYGKNDTHFFVPREWKPENFKLEIEDQTVTVPVEIPFKGKLRDYQEEPVNVVLANGGGVLVSPTGSGKTVMGIKMAAELGQRTMILVHKKILMDQWADRIKEFTGMSAGIIGDGRAENIKSPIVVGMVQTLIKKRYEDKKKFFDSFGLVIGDECHRHGASLWQQAIGLFPAKYRIGLSATPYRTDKLDNIIFWNFGQIAYEIKPQMSAKVIQKEITEGGHGRGQSYLDLMRELSNIPERNGVILRDTAAAVRKGRFVLVLTKFVDHVESLYTAMKAVLPKKVARVYGRVQDPITPETKVIVGTYSYLKEGVDIPELDTLIYALPVLAKVDIVQSAGRILRSCPGKESPVIMDYIDTSLRNLGEKRKRVFEELGFSITDKPTHSEAVTIQKHWTVARREQL